MTTPQPTPQRRRPRTGNGRRSKLTPEVHERIVQAIRAGATMEAAAGAVGIPEGTLYRWLHEAEQPAAPAWKREFREDIYRARDELEVRVSAGSVLKAAMGGYVVKRVTRTRPDGTVEHEEQIAPADGRVGLELLGRRFPQRWGRRLPIEVSGPGGGPIEVAHSSTIAELAERLHVELASVVPELDGGDVVDIEVISEEDLP